MLHIKLTQADRPQPVEAMSQRDLYETARGDWVLGERAMREHFALVSYDGLVRLAMRIKRISRVVIREDSDTRDHRSRIEGDVLVPGDEVYDYYVGKPTPVDTGRNPIKYFDSPVGRVPCKCGCGDSLAVGDFLPGHDQKALHDRVAQIGSVSEFIDWFDQINRRKQ